MKSKFSKWSIVVLLLIAVIAYAARKPAYLITSYDGYDTCPQYLSYEDFGDEKLTGSFTFPLIAMLGVNETSGEIFISTQPYYVGETLYPGVPWDVVDAHLIDDTNPHNVTASQIGLDGATSDIAGLTQDLAGATSDIADLTGDLAGATSDIADLISNLAGATADAASLKINNDQLGTAAGALSPFAGGAISSGTLAGVAAVADHPGVNELKSAAGNNSGYTIFTSAFAFIAGAEDKGTFIFKTANAANGYNRWRAGYDQGITIADSNNGVWFYFDQAAGTIAGKSRDAGGAVQTTATAYTYVDDTWYRGEFEIDGDGDTIVYTIYTCSDGASVWSDSLGTIPTGTVLFGITAWNTAPTAALVIVTLDKLEIAIRRTLAR